MVKLNKEILNGKFHFLCTYASTSSITLLPQSADWTGLSKFHSKVLKDEKKPSKL